MKQKEKRIILDTKDSLLPGALAVPTLDSLMVGDSAGVFLQHELERIDPVINDPLVNYTWTRDVTLRTDVTIADEIASFTFNEFTHPGNIYGNGKNFIAPNDTAVAGPAVDLNREGYPLHLWGSEVKYTVIELAKAMQVNRPLEMQYVEAMQLKWQMDNDEMVYIGDSTVGAEGLFNSTKPQLVVATNNDWSPSSGITPDAILAEINYLIATVWRTAAYAEMPTRILVSPNIFAQLVSMKVSDAGNVSVMEYLKQNNILRAQYGQELEILPSKWAYQRGATTTMDRMFAYNPNPRFIRYPLVPLQRTPVMPKGLHMTSIYYGKMGHIEFRYPQTMAYMDLVSW